MKLSMPCLTGFTVALVVLLGGVPSAQTLAGESKLTSKLLGMDFTRVNRVSELPPEVVSAVSAMAGGQELVDPEHLRKAATGQKSTEGPQLIFAGKSPSLWVVHFARGGQADGYELAILELQPTGQVGAKLHMVSEQRAWSVPNLKNMVRQGQFKADETVAGQ